MNVSNGVLLAATIGGPAVGAIAVVVSGLNSRGDRRNVRGIAKDQRDHEQRQMRSQRLHTSRLVPYEELLTYMHHSMLRVDRTEPILGPVPPPPAQVPVEEALQLQVRASMFGSPEVTEAAEEFISKVNGFFVYANTYAMMRDQGGDSAEAAAQMNGHREQAGQVLRRVQDMIRDELAEL
jgi:hypothetical protein